MSNKGSMRLSELNFLMEKLYEIDKHLGGNSKQKGKAKGLGMFEVYKEFVIKTLFTVAKKQDERDARKDKQGRNQQVITDEIQIKGLLLDVKRELGQMEKLNVKYGDKPKKYPKELVAHNQKVLESLQENYNNINDRENGGDFVKKDKDDYKTITELKALWQEREGYERPEINIAPDEEEVQAMQRWKLREEDQDRKLDQIIQGIEIINGMAKQIGDKIDHTESLLNELESGIDKNNKKLTGHNAALKELIKSFSTPSRLFLDLMLFGLLVGLVYLMYQMIKKGK